MLAELKLITVYKINAYALEFRMCKTHTHSTLLCGKITSHITLCCGLESIYTKVTHKDWVMKVIHNSCACICMHNSYTHI